jgi:GNAT superfamily N-acetyltransferase
MPEGSLHGAGKTTARARGSPRGNPQCGPLWTKSSDRGLIGSHLRAGLTREQVLRVGERPGGSSVLGALVAFHEGLSDRSRLFRFLSLGLDLGATLAPLVGADVTGLVVVIGSQIVGHGCLVPIDHQRAEVAFAVAEEWQHRGVATVLLERLVMAGGERGLTSCPISSRPTSDRRRWRP